jgi:hypothetical protein
MAHGADTAGRLCEVANAAEYRRDVIAMFECRDEVLPFFGVTTQPVQELREPPFRRIRAATPMDRFQISLVRFFRDFGGFAPGAVIGPKIVIIERLKIRAHGNDC